MRPSPPYGPRRRRLGCAAGISVLLTLGAPPAHAAGPADFVVDRLRIDAFRQNISDLASFVSRYWSQPGNATAVDYIRNELVSFGYTNVTLDSYTFSGQTRHNIYATKVGTVRPTEMYIVSGHMDSFSRVDVRDAPGADDDGSGTALVLEIARVFADVTTEVSVRFILFNNEETGLNGSRAYVAGHRAGRGTLDEPDWLGVIQHDMILYDRFPVPDADIEYAAAQSFGGKAIDLGDFLAGAMTRYGTLPAEVTGNMCCTDSVSFASLAPAVSVRENRRRAEIGNNSNPNYHQPTDRAETYTDADYAFGFNIVRMTAGAVAELAGARPDCNHNDVPDADDIAAGRPDTNGDGVLDECQDCNGNAIPDPVEIDDETAADCNGNGRPDACDLADGTPGACVPADFDRDGDVDLADALVITACLTLPGDEPAEGCAVADFDHDRDVDLADYVAFQTAFTGSQ